MTAPKMTGKERRALRARAHALKPVIMIGAGGVSDGVIAETDRALDDHELIKVKVAHEERAVRGQLIDSLCSSLDAQHIQSIGKTAVIYREHIDED